MATTICERISWVRLKFGSSKEGVGITHYVDSNYARDLDKRRSTTSYISLYLEDLSTGSHSYNQ